MTLSFFGLYTTLGLLSHAEYTPSPSVNIHHYLLCMCVCSVASIVSDSESLWTVARQAPLSMGFSRQEYWSGLPFPPLEELPHPGIEPTSLTSPALAGRFLITAPPAKPIIELTFPTNNVCSHLDIKSKNKKHKKPSS